MSAAGAPPAAVAFTRALQKESAGDVGIMSGFNKVGPVDVAFVVYPLRANTNNGLLFVNGTPPIVNAENLKLLDQTGMQQSPQFQNTKAQFPDVNLWPGDRDGTTWPNSSTNSDGSVSFTLGYPLLNGVTHLSARLPSYVQDAADGHGWIGQLVRQFHLQQWVAQNAPKLQTLGASLAKPALNFGKGAASVLATLLTIFALSLLLLLEGPKIWTGLLGWLSPARADRWSRMAREINQSVTGYVVGDLLTSIICGLVVFVTLAALGVPFPLLWALWVALVDFLPMIGGALAGIPTVLFATAHSLTDGIVTAAVFVAYQQLENHVLNPVIMSRTVKVNPLLVLLAVLFGTSLGDWVGGLFGGFVAALLSIPCAAALQVIVREIWRATAQPNSYSSHIDEGNTARDAIVFAAGKSPDELPS